MIDGIDTTPIVSLQMLLLLMIAILITSLVITELYTRYKAKIDIKKAQKDATTSQSSNYKTNQIKFITNRENKKVS